MDVYAWVDEQRDKNRRKFAQLLEEGRQIWTPRNIFNTCCVKWLVDGRKKNYEDDFYSFDEYSPRNGCTSCERDHPMITLGFDSDSNSTTATLSHRLDPFLHYFEGLVAEGKAQRSTSTVYKLDGYLRPNFTALRSYDGFGSHLIKVDDGAMEASDTSQTAEIEETERAKKRPRVNSDNDIDINEGEEDRKKPPDMSKEVMDIVMSERLKIDLQNDPLSLYCMRSVNKLFKKMADSIASEKMKTLTLSITPLVNGKERYGQGKIDGYDSETFDVGCWGTDDVGGASDVVCYDKKEKVSLEYREVDGGYYPTDETAAAATTFSWDSGELNVAAEPDDAEECEERADYSTYAYRGQMMRVYWHPSSEDPVKPQTRAELDIWSGGIIQKPSLGVLVAEFYLGRRLNEGNRTKSSRYASIDYEVVESNALQREEEVEESDIGSDDDDDDQDGDRRRKVCKYIRYSGTVKITKLSVDYRLLVEKHAQRVGAELRQKHMNIKKERPLTQSEKDYEELVTKVA